MFVTKTAEAQELFRKGDFKQSLKIFKTFKIGLNKSEKRSLEIAYECLTGKESFYKGLGINCEQERLNAERIIREKYIN